MAQETYEDIDDEEFNSDEDLDAEEEKDLKPMPKKPVSRIPPLPKEAIKKDLPKPKEDVMVQEVAIDLTLINNKLNHIINLLSKK